MKSKLASVEWFFYRRWVAALFLNAIGSAPGHFLRAVFALVVLTGFMATPGEVHANRVVNSATLDGGASVSVSPGATISAAVEVTTNNTGSGNNWQSTGWRIATTAPGAVTCVDHPNHNNSGTYVETFNMTAPVVPGTYNAYFVAYDNNTCSSGSSATYILASAVVVVPSPPDVVSINRSSFDPTSANTSVSWTVVFDASVTGVDVGDFALTQAGGVTGASILSVSGSGTTWTVTANTGTGTTGTLRLDLVDNDTIVSGGLPLGGAGLGNGNFSGQSYTLVLPYCATVPTAIYCDDFERASPGSVGNGWTVTPANVTNCTSTDPTNTGCAGIDRDIAPFNNYAVPHATNTRSMFTRWNIVSVDSPTVNLAGRPAALLSFWMRRGSDAFSEYPEATGENYLVEYWDGAAWQILAQYPSGVMQGEVFTPVIQLPPAALHADFKLRFYQPAGSGKTGAGGAPGVVGYDYWHMDNVVITEAPSSSYVGPFCDNFEGGMGRWSISAEGFPGTTSIGDARLGSTDFNSAGHELDMRWGYVVASTLRTDMRGVGGDITYWVKSGGGTTNRAPDAGENLVAEYYNNAGSWTLLATYLANGSTTSTIYNASFPLPADAKHEGFRLRFRQLAGSGYDRDYWHVDDVCVGSGLPTADLALSKTRGAPLVPGANVPYTLSVINNGPGTLAGSLQIVDTLPAELSYFSASGTGWSCSVAGQIVTCGWVGTLASGSSAPPLTLTATLSVSATGTVTNTATVTGTVTDNNLANNTASETGSVDTATKVAEYHLDEASWNGTSGEVKDTAGYAGGPFNGSALASSSPLPTPTLASPALAGSPGTCGYASLPGPAANGGAFTLSGLPLATTAGSKSSVAFWMYWDGTDSVMPIGWSQHGLLLAGGSFGFTTNNGDIYGVSSAGLANGWHHVAAVFTNGSVTSNQLYIDGALQTLSQRMGSPNLANAMVGSTLQVGGWLHNTGLRFVGFMDEVLVYRNVLSPAEVATIYAATHACPPMLNHIRIEHDGEGLTCTPEPVTVRACANANCTSEYSGSVTTTFSPAGWVGGDTITFSGGHTIAQLSKTTAGTVTLGAGSTTPVPTVGTRCFNGAVETCSLNFVNTGFIFSITAVSPFNQVIPLQTAGLSSGNLYLVAVRTDTTAKACEAALQGANAVNLAYECIDPSSCYAANLMSVNGGSATTIPRNNAGSVSSYAAVNMTFDANGAAPFTMVYNDVGEVRLHANKLVNGATLSGSGGGTGSSGGIVVKPYDFLIIPCTSATPCLTAPADPGLAGGGGVFAKAGNPFSVTVTARTASGAVTPSFGHGTANDTESVSLTQTLQAPTFGSATGNSAGTLGGTTSIPRSSFTNGVASVSDVSWDEVGVITLTATNSKFLGNLVSTTGVTGNIGRFIPDHFDTIVTGPCPTATCACPTGLTCPAQFNGFVYSAQPFSVEVIAKNLAGGKTVNYGGAFARNVVLSAWDAKGSTTTQNPPGATPGALSNNALGPTLFSQGSALAPSATYALPNAFPASVSPPGPTDIYLRAAESGGDGVTSLRPVAASSIEGGIKVISGRFFIPNSYGSELLKLPINGTVQYFNGTRWTTSDTDNQSQVVAPTNIGFSNYKGNLTSVSVAGAPVTTTVAKGICPLPPSPSPSGCFILEAPGSGKNGSVDIKLVSPAWLPSTTGRTTFGIYKSDFIYLREMY